MSAASMHDPEHAGTGATIRATSEILQVAGPRSATADAAPGSPEGRYLGGLGRGMYRRFMDLTSELSVGVAQSEELENAANRAGQADQERRDNHRGGERTWLLRPLILPGLAAEAITAFVAIEVLVSSFDLAVGLSVLTAFIGGGMACVLANRRLDRHRVPATARWVEALLVGVVAALRYESLRIQGADLVTAVGAALLAALISALVLLGIEEIVLETKTFAMFVSSVRVSLKKWRLTGAQARIARTRARIDSAITNLQQHYLEFLLKVEGLALDEARRRAAALASALRDRGQ